MKRALSEVIYIIMLAKIVKKDDLLLKIRNLREKGKRVVFTNGCFDLLHVGHIRYLAAAKSEGDILVVGLNSDTSVQAIKGQKRPIVPQDERAEVLAGLWCVDYIVLFTEPDPLNLIRVLAPDVLVKGGDWPENSIIGADFVKAQGGKVVRVPVVPDASSSGLIQKIIKSFG
jgi:D-beta-D-heptose 7-phosphate kinase/D-beta-D-heptose 1-phosphate adenosyltransferase